MNADELKETLKNNVVIFEYTKTDGTTRTAKGTLREDLLPKREPDEFELEKNAVDTLISEKYGSMEEYMNENKIELVGESKDGAAYLFRHKKKTVKKNENVVNYYDLEKNQFRSFKKENFIKIVTIEE